MVSKLSLASSSPRVLHRAVFKKINLLNFIWRCGVGRNQRRRRRSDDECSRCFGTRGRLGGYDDSGRRKAAERAARLALEEWMKSYPLTVAQGAASRRRLLTPTTQFGNDGPLLSGSQKPNNWAPWLKDDRLMMSFKGSVTMDNQVGRVLPSQDRRLKRQGRQGWSWGFSQPLVRHRSLGGRRNGGGRDTKRARASRTARPPGRGAMCIVGARLAEFPRGPRDN